MNFLRHFFICFLLVMVIPVAGLYAADDDIPEGGVTQNCPTGQYYWDEEQLAWGSGGLKAGQVCLAFPMKFVYKNVVPGSGCSLNGTEDGEIEVSLNNNALSIKNDGWLEINDNKCYFSSIQYDSQGVAKETGQVDIGGLGDIIKRWISDPERKVLDVEGTSKNYVVSYYLNDEKALINGLTTKCTFYNSCSVIGKNKLIERLSSDVLQGKYISNTMSLIQKTNTRSTEEERQVGFGADIKSLEDYFVYDSQDVELDNGTGFKISLQNCADLKDSQYCKDYEVAACDQGSYVSENKMSCKLCEVGYYCPDGDEKIQCSAGYYCQAGAKEQTKCPAGSKCPDNQMGQPTECESGTYQPNTGQKSCLSCEKGNYTSKTTGDVGNTQCSSCNAGYYCPDGENIKQCPVGASCPAGSGDYVKCTGSSYQNKAEQTSCKTCPAGSYTSGEGDASGNTTCTSCPAGYYCPDGNNRKECSAGYYCPAGAKEQTECPAGSKCPDDQMGQPTKCESGTYQPNTGQQSCLTCESGYYCPDGKEKTMCAKGTYQDETGQSECKSCPAGAKCSKAGLKEPEYCTDNTYQVEEGQTSCQECLGGSYTSGEGEASGNTTCTSCPENYYCPGNGTMVQCRFNQFCPAGAASPGTCPDGQVKECSGGGWWYTCSCEPCEEGHYCRGGEEIVCDAGFYCPAGVSEQTKCEAGYYCPAKSSQQIECPAGAKCDGGASYSVCLVGTYQDKTGQSECKSCPAGAKCSRNGLKAPEYCKGSSYQDKAGQTSCETCDAGSYTSGTTGNTTCTSCPAGSYCPDGDEKITCSAEEFEYCSENDTGLDSPGQCENGTYPAMIGNSGVSTCEKCPAGSYCSGGRKDLCPAGAACLGTGRTEPMYCTGSSYQDKEGQIICKTCFAGWYTSGEGEAGGNTKCTVCPAGSYCNGNEKKECPALFTSLGNNSKIINDCFINTDSVEFCDDNNNRSCYKLPVKVYYSDQQVE